MESDVQRTGDLFLSQTKLADSSIQPGKEPDVKVCGVCEPSRKMIPLPPPSGISVDPVFFYDVLDARRTIREFSEASLMRWELSILLHYTQGIRPDEPTENFRTVPSAGNIHPFETYLVINRVEGIAPGIYRYLPLDHALVGEQCHAGDYEAVSATCRRPELIRSSAVTFLWTAVPERMCWKFGARGWRYLFIESGHICQNLYLTAGAIGCGVCAIGSYRDDEMNCALGLAGTREFCIYVAAVGKKKIS